MRKMRGGRETMNLERETFLLGGAMKAIVIVRGKGGMVLMMTSVVRGAGMG